MLQSSSGRISSAKTSLTGHDLRAGDTCIRHLAYVSHQRISKCTSSFQLRNLYHHKSCYRWRWCLQAAQVESSSELSSSIEPASPFTTMEKSAARLNTAERLSALGITELSPAALFDDHHIDDLNLLLLAYFPFGCVVAAFRMALWVVGVALDAPWFRQPSVIGAWVYLLGVSVTWTDQQNIPQEQRHVLVSNHVSMGDLLVLFQQPQRYVHFITNALPQQVYAAQHLPAILLPANKEVYLCLAQSNGQQHQRQQVLAEQQEHQGYTGGVEREQQQPCQQVHLATGTEHQHHHQLGVSAPAAGLTHTPSASSGCTSSSSSGSSNSTSSHQQPATANSTSSSSSSGGKTLDISKFPTFAEAQSASVHLFPEGGMTNGSGLMKFSRGFMLFADKLPVVPVALRVRPALPLIKCHTLTSHFLATLFWFSFQPWTCIEAKALPPMQLQLGESKAAFVQRVELAIAEELQVWATDFSIQQKRQKIKQQRKQRNRKT